MKIALSFLSILIIGASCSTKSKEASDEWKELDSFHMVMAESFHPYMDSANLAPAKSLAKTMADEATKWASAELPEKVNNEEMKGKLNKLTTDSQSFLKQVNENAPDSVVGQSLTNLHQLFHEIQEGWYGGGKKHLH